MTEKDKIKKIKS